MWVLESAYRYGKASAFLLQAGLTYESEVNAALAMELLIKSLLVAPLQNDRFGTVLQQYDVPKHFRPKDGHDLFQLYEKVPTGIAEKVGLASQEDLLQIKRDVFRRARYIYEEGAPRGSDSLLLHGFFWLFPQVVAHIVEIGEADEWVKYMMANPEEMRLASLTELLSVG